MAVRWTLCALIAVAIVSALVAPAAAQAPIVAAGALRVSLGFGTCGASTAITVGPFVLLTPVTATMSVDPATGSGSLAIVVPNGPMFFCYRPPTVVERWSEGSCSLNATRDIACPGATLKADGSFAGHGWTGRLMRSDTAT